MTIQMLIIVEMRDLWVANSKLRVFLVGFCRIALFRLHKYERNALCPR
jgi:hypothetical protein